MRVPKGWLYAMICICAIGAGVSYLSELAGLATYYAGATTMAMAVLAAWWRE